MLGFFRFKKSVNVAAKAVLALFGPAAINGASYGNLPNAVFGDAFVIGFIQCFSVYIMCENRAAGVDSVEQFAIFTAVLNRLVPGYGAQITALLTEVNHPTHTFHSAYIAGKECGRNYVTALKVGDEIGAQAHLNVFVDFIKRNYLS